MESTSSPSHIQASDVFFSSLPDEMRILFTPRTVDVKGKGVMNTWILDVADKEEELARFRLDLTALPGWSKIVSGRGL